MTDIVAKLGTILGVWAHPDDESFMTGGLMAAAAANGQKVICITATKGEAGQYDKTKYPEGKLGEVRAKELENALKVLGVKTHHWLGYHDGQCYKVPDAGGTAQVIKFIEKYSPDTILTFPPDGLTGHDDHKAASRWARLAIKQSGKPINLYYAVDTQENYDKFLKKLDEKFNFYFNIDHPVLVPLAKCDIQFKLTPKLAEQKIRAIKAMASQTEGMFDEFGEQGFMDAMQTEAYVKADHNDPAKWPL